MVNTIILCLTDGCNLRCKGCYIDNNNYKIDILKIMKGLNILIKKYCIKKIILHGGEPLYIGKEDFEEVAKYIRKISPNVRLSIQTNVTLIDKEWVDIFKKYDIKVGISYRGYKELFEELSCVEKYDDFLNGITLLRQYGLLRGGIFYFPSEYRDIIYKNIGKIIDDIVSLGISSIDIHESVECGKIENFSDIIIKAQEYIFEKGYNLSIRELDMIYKLVIGRNSSRVCSWAHNCYDFIALSGKGEFYRCNRRPNGYKILYDECLLCPIFGLCEGGCEKIRELNNGKNPYCEDRINMYKYVVENINKFYLHYDF